VSYRQDNTEKSLQNLNSIINESNGSNSHKEKKNQFYNNSSLVYLKQKKFHLACMYSQKAVDVIKRAVLSDVKEEIVVKDMAQREDIEEKNDDLKICDNEKQKESEQEMNEELDQSVHYCGALPQRCTAELLYNTAVTFLLSGNPLGALLYFEQIVSDFGNSPLLWIRMGECCIRCHADQLKNRETGQILCASGYTGRGNRLQFQCDDSLSSEGIDADNGSTSQSNCSLNKAVQYLSKAVFLIRKIRDKSNPDFLTNNSDQNTSVGEEGSPILSSDSSSSSRIPCRVDSIESAALVRLTYVHLELNSPLSAYTAANAILASPHLSSTGSETRYVTLLPHQHPYRYLNLH
jgi:tetratricopeptide (TPR) repeat protein